MDSPQSDDSEYTGQQADAEDSQLPGHDDATIDDGDPDSVEIGDPVPEEDRTVRALEGEEALLGDELLGDDEETGVDPDPDPSSQRH
jgi:hypothetical protein